MYIDHYRLHPRAGVHGWEWPFSICLFYSLSYLSLLNDYCSDRTSQVCITEFLFQPGSKMIALWHAHCQGKTNMNKVGLSVLKSLQDLFFKPYRVILVMSLCQHRLSCKAIEGRGRAEQKAGQEKGGAGEGRRRRALQEMLCPGSRQGDRWTQTLPRHGSCLPRGWASPWPACHGHAVRSSQLCACAQGGERLGTLSWVLVKAVGTSSRHQLSSA